jgi:ATP-dependent Lhr-like helicase
VESLGDPTPPQALGWPAIRRGEHTLIQAPTGSGKTLAAFLVGIDRLWSDGRAAPPPGHAGVRLLYISPLKALNNDIERNLRAPLAGIRATASRMDVVLPRLRVAVRTGDTPQSARQTMVRKPPDILITTPESLFLVLTSPRAREMLRTVETVIVDEIHTLLGNKRGAHLALSLERLTALAGEPVQRIGLSATIKPLSEAALWLGGQTIAAPDPFAGVGAPVLTPRPVTVVDAACRKALELEVITPVDDFRELPGDTVWPSLVPQLLGDILRHRTTLIFTNNRRLAERTADRLNAQIAAERSEEVPPGSTEVLAPKGVARDRGIFAIGAKGPIRAHHGSMSLEARRGMEEDLKAGRLPALVSTGTLELGIDIGAVDLVVQLQSPKSVSQGLQRVGRSGHLVGQTSRGRVYATYREDLVEAAAVSLGMLEGDVEPTACPASPLDVLAQQVIAAISVEEWREPALLELVRQAYPYATLSDLAWTSVLSMVSGRYQSLGGPAHGSLAARIAWDRENGRLAPLPGARLLATSNAGTISDTGAFDVCLADGKTRLGTLDEEFVFESRPGDTFLLGSSVWRVLEMKDDRIIVGDAAGALPRMPFWRGDYPWRPYELGVRVGRLRRELASRLRDPSSDPDEAMAWLQKAYPVDRRSAANLVAYVGHQLSIAGVISSDTMIVVETFTDAVGDARIVVHSPFGGRVNSAWALALSDAIRERAGVAAENHVSDDGILLRLPGAEAKASDLAVALVSGMTPGEARERILRELPASPLFGAHFRMNAARALLLPRARGRKRTPFWLQRLKARDLLATVRNVTDFPIVAETYRDCLRDALDLPRLEQLLSAILAHEVEIGRLASVVPSPLAAGLLASFANTYMYEGDTPKAERQLHALTLGSELIEDLLDGADSGRVPLLTETPDPGPPPRPAASADALAAYLLEHGDLTEAEIAERFGDGALALLAQLQGAGRVVLMMVPTALGFEARWAPAELAPEYASILGDAAAPRDTASPEVLLRRLLRLRGPITRAGILERYAFQEPWLDETLDRLVKGREVVSGRFGGPTNGSPRFCDRHEFERLYRRSVAALRREAAPASREAYQSFLLARHGLTPGILSPEPEVGPVTGTEGIALPALTWRREMLPARLDRTAQSRFQESLSGGDYTWVLVGPAARSARIRIIARGDGALYLTGLPLTRPPGDTTPQGRAYRYLVAEGPSFVADIATGAGLGPAETRAALAWLALRGLVHGDSIAALDAVLAAEDSAQQAPPRQPEPHFAPRDRADRRRPPYYLAHRAVTPGARAALAAAPLWAGRWMASGRSAQLGPTRSAEQWHEQAARAALVRHGIVTVEILARHESSWSWADAESPNEVAWSWADLHAVLTQLELRGEVRRGYFVAGLSGVQFALPGAIEQLRAQRSAPVEGVVVLSALDPALAPWSSQDTMSSPGEPDAELRYARIPSTHIALSGGRVILVAEESGARFRAEPGASEELLMAALQAYLRRLGAPRRTTIERWNGVPVLESAAAPLLRSLGASRTPSGLDYWTD